MDVDSTTVRTLEYRCGNDPSIVTSRFEVVILSENGWMRHGQYDAYFNDGTLRASGRYENGRMEGKWQYFHYEGHIVEHGSFRDSKRVGHWQFYTYTGELKRESEDLDGWRHGYTKNYFENGSVESEGMFEHGMPVGIWRFYEPDGAGYEGEVEYSGDPIWD
jgi:antitoxin component YwqK of YwqJK toxin-antitoxin module